MKRNGRITIIVLFLTAILFAGTMYFQHSTAHACGSYMINGSRTTINYTPPGISESVVLSLWYNSCNSNNFTQANATGIVDDVIVQTRRSDGAVSSRTVCGANGTCTSEGIYSPTLTAQACVSLVTAGLTGTEVCTSFF